MMKTLYLIKNNNVIDNNTFTYMLEILPVERQKQILRQRIKQNADNMLIGSILAKYAIKNEFGIPITKQIFGIGEHGKPYLKNHPNIHFNVSHSGQYVVCAVADVPVGVDVQKVSEFNIGVTERVCNKQELTQILTSTNKASEFIKLWTQKEAYVKMLGCGIGMCDLKSVPTEKAETTCIDNYYISICKEK